MRSTNDAVHNRTDHVAKDLDKKKCLAIFLDLAKAFDSISVLNKLESIGIRSTQLKLYRSYLTIRIQRVKIGDQISDDIPIEYVSQGSVFGPSLFLIDI